MYHVQSLKTNDNQLFHMEQVQFICDHELEYLLPIINNKQPYYVDNRYKY